MGESEVIALALQVNPQWIILDDLAARRVAEAAGLPVIGTLGVLLQAKDAEHITMVKPLLDKLRSANMFVSEALYAHILGSAGEAE